jgi:hypothetical protein
MMALFLLSIAISFATIAEENDAGRDLEIGDVLLFQSKTGKPFYWLDWLLQNAFGCRFSHVAMYWGNNLIIGAGEKGVNFSSIKQETNITKILRYPGLTEKQKQTMQANSMAVIGTPYPSIRELIEMGLTFLKYFTIENPFLEAIAKPIFSLAAFIFGINQENRIFTNLNSSDGWQTVICTEFVFRTFESVGIELESQKTPDFLLPDDFLKYPSLTEVE